MTSIWYCTQLRSYIQKRLKFWHNWSSSSYHGSFTPRAPWNRNGMRNSSSYAGVSSHRSESMQSVNSLIFRSSVCSDIGRCTLSNHTCSIPEIENDVDKDWCQLLDFMFLCCVSSCSVNILFCFGVKQLVVKFGATVTACVW